MSEPDCKEVLGAPQDLAPEFLGQIALLRAAGADKFDRARFGYIEALAGRAIAHQGSVKHMLDAKLAGALTALEKRFQLAQDSARKTVEQSVQRYPHAANDLQRLLAAGDFGALRRFVATLKTREQCASIGALVRRLEQPASDKVVAPMEKAGDAPAELKAVREFRSTWSRLSVDKQVAQAFEQAPKNAGPINSHMLVLRSLALMRDISPGYLNQFMSYADTLLCLDQEEKEKPATPKKQRATRAKKK